MATEAAADIQELTVHSEVDCTSSDKTAKEDHPEDPGKQLESTVNESHEDVKNQETKSVPVTEVSTEKFDENESAVTDKVEDDKNTSVLLKEDLDLVPEKSKASDIGQDNKTNVNLHGTTSDITEDKEIDAVDTQKKVFESFSTVVSSYPEEVSANAVIQEIPSGKAIDEVEMQKEVIEKSSSICSTEEIQEKSMVEVDASERKIVELLEKEGEEVSLSQPLARESSDQEYTVMHEARIEDEEPRKPEPCEIETSTRSLLPEIESNIKKPEDSLNVSSEDAKTSYPRHEISSFDKEKETPHPQDGKPDDKAVDADDIKGVLHETVQPIVLNVTTVENSLIQEDDPQKKDENLEKENEKPYLTKDLDQETKASSIEEQCATSHSEISMDQKKEDKALDAAETEEIIENASTDSNKTGEKLLIIDGCLHTKKDHLEKDIVNQSLIEDVKGNANENEFTSTGEIKPEDVNSTQLLEKGKHIESDLVKEEVCAETAVEDNKASDMGQYTETTSFSEDQSLTKIPQGILGEETKGETTINADGTREKTELQQNVAIEFSNEDTGENTPIQLEAPQMKHDTHLAREASDNASMVTPEALTEDGEPRKAEPREIEASSECMLQETESRIEEPENSLILDSKDIKTTCSSNEVQNVQTIVKNDETKEIPLIQDTIQNKEENFERGNEMPSLTKDLGQEIESSSFEEQIATPNSQIILDQEREDKTHDTAESMDENLENVSTTDSNEKTEEKSLIQVGGPQNKIEEHIEKNVEKPSLIKDFLGNVNDSELTVTYEVEAEDVNSEELLEKGENIESSLMKVNVDAPEEDNKASDLGQYTETTGFSEDQNITKNSQGILNEKTEDKTTDADDDRDKAKQQQNVVEVSNEDNDNSPIQLNAPQMEHGINLAKETSDNESMVTHEALSEDGEQIKADQCEIHTSRESMLGEIKSKIEKQEDSLIVASEDVKTSFSSHEIGSFEEENAAVQPQNIKTDEEADDANEIKKEIHENVLTIVSNEKTDENSLIKGDEPQKKDENLEKDNEKPSLAKDLGHEIESSCFEEQRAEPHSQIILNLEKEDRNLDAAESKEENLENVSTTYSNEKTEKNSSTQVDSPQTKIGEHLEKEETSEDQSLTKSPQGILREKTEDKTSDALSANEKTKQQQDDDNNSSIQLDAPQKKHDTDLEKEIEKQHIMEASTEDNNKERPIIHVAEIDNESIIKVASFGSDRNIDIDLLKKEKLQEAAEDHKPTSSSEDLTICSLDNQSLTENPQSITNDRKSDVTKEIDLEQVATKIPHERTEEDLAAQVDCSQTENEEHLEKGSEASVEKTNDNESELHEFKDREEDLIQAELFESEKNTVTTLAKEEARVEKHTDCVIAASDDIKASDSTHDANVSLIEDPREIPNDNKEERTDDAAEMKIPELKDITTHILDGDLEVVSLEKAVGNVSEAAHDPTSMEEHIIKADLLEEEKHGVLAREEMPAESLQVANEDIKASASVEDREISSPEEQTLTTKNQVIIGDGNKTNYVNNLEEEFQEDKNAAMITSHEDSGESPHIQVNVSQIESENLDKQSESVPLTEALTNDTAEKSLAKEEDIEKPIDYVQAATEDTIATVHIDTGSIKEQIPISDPQEISEGKITEAAYTTEKSLEDAETKVPHANRENEDTLSFEMDGLQKPSLEEASTRNTCDDESINIHECKFVDEQLTEASSFENEKNIECMAAEKEELLESLQEAGEDNKASASCHDTDTTSLMEQDQKTGDKEDKTIEATHLKEETPDEKNVATIPDENTEENLQSQVDSSRIEQKGNLQEESENASPVESESLARDITESSLKEKASAEKSTDHFQRVTGDTEVSASGQGMEISYKQEQVTPADPPEISCDKIEGKSTDASYTPDGIIEDVVTNVPKNGDDEDNPLSLKETSIGSRNDVESPVTHEAKFEDEPLMKAQLVDNEKYTECNLESEKVAPDSLIVAAEEIIASAPSQKREISSLEAQSLTTNSEEVDSDQKEQIVDVTELEKEACKDKKSTIHIPYENIENDSPIERSEHVEKESKNPALAEAQTGETRENILLEEPEMETLQSSIKVSTKDNKPFISSQDRETSSIIEEQIPTVDPQEIPGEENIADVTDKEGPLKFQDVAIEIPSDENEDNSQTKADCLQNPTLKEALTKNTPEVQEIATNIPSGEDENLPTKEDGSQKPSLAEASTGNIVPHVSKIMHEPRLVDESFLKAGLAENEENTYSDIKEEKSVESEQITTEDSKAFASVQDRGTSFQEEQSSNKNVNNDKENKTVVSGDLKEETSQDVAIEVPSGENEDSSPTEVDCSQDPTLTEALTKNALEEIATNIPSGEIENNSPTKVDGSQEPSLTEASTGNAAHHVTKIMHEPELVDESILKVDLTENEENSYRDIKEEKSNDSLHETSEDRKASASLQDKGTSFQEGQSFNENPQEHVDNDKEDKTVAAGDLSEETSQENASESVAADVPLVEYSDANTDSVLDRAEDPNSKKEESSTTTAQEVYTRNINENVASSASELSEQESDKAGTEKAIETVPSESLKADAHVPDEESKAEFKEDAEAGISEDALESNKLEEEGINSNVLRDTSGNSNSVALEEITSSNVESEVGSTFNPSLESSKETRLETENQQAQKQDGDLHAEKIELDVEACPVSSTDPEITQEMENLEEESLPALSDNTIENRDCNESEVVEESREVILNDKELTETEQEKIECKQEKLPLTKTVEECKDPASIPVANEFLPKPCTETPDVDTSTVERRLATITEDLKRGITSTGDHEETKLDKDKEDEVSEQKISHYSSAAVNTVVADDKDGAGRSIAELDAPEVTQTVLSVTESKEVESTCVGEASALLSQRERDDYEHAQIGTEEKIDSNEVGFAPEGGKSGNDVNYQVIESIGQVQSCGVNSKAEGDLEAATSEIKSETLTTENIFEQKETTTVEFSSGEVKGEDEEVKNDDLSSCKEESITESHLEVQPKQEEKAISEEIFHVIRNANETEKVSKVSEAANEPEETLLENESIERSQKQEQEKAVEDVITVPGTEKLGQSYIDAGAKDSRGEVNSSAVKFLNDEDKATWPNDIDNGKAKDEGLHNQNSDTHTKDAVSGEQPKIPDEDIPCEAPTAKTVPELIEDDESKKASANANIVQYQEEDNKIKHESDQLPESTQGKESVKHDQNYEIFLSEEVQTKDEVNLVLSAGKCEEEAHKGSIWTKATEDEDKSTYVEAEKIEFSSLTKDTSEVSQQHDASMNVPEDDDNPTTKNVNPETKVSSEEQKAEVIDKSIVSETIKLEIDEKQLERTSGAVTKAEVDTTEEKIIDDDSNNLIESAAASENILGSNTHRISEEDTTQSDENQECHSQADSHPILPVAKCSEIEISKKDLPTEFQALENTSGTKIREETPIPSKEKHTVPENMIGEKNITAVEHDFEGELELQKNAVSEKEKEPHEHEEKTGQETRETVKPSLSNPSQATTSDEKEATTHLLTETNDEAEHAEAKTDDEDEHRQSELCSEAPVMVNMGDADAKVGQKKSHNILSGVGSKVKHSIAKVKKAITGKSSHPKPSSPK